MERISITQGVSCSRCAESYELGGVTNHTGEELPWLCVTRDHTDADKAVKETVCQRCLEFRGTDSLLSVLRKLDVEISTKVIPLPSPRKALVLGGTVRREVKGAKPGLQVRTPRAVRGTGKRSVTVGGRTVDMADLAQGARRDAPASQRRRPAPRKPRVRDGEASSSLGDSLRRQLAEALESGSDRKREAVGRLAHTMGVHHELSEPFFQEAEARAAEERAAQEAEKQARKLHRLRQFRSRIGHARRNLNLARARTCEHDVTHEVAEVRRHIVEACKLDPEQRSKRRLTEEVLETSEAELDQLVQCFFDREASGYQGKAVVPVRNDGDPQGCYSSTTLEPRKPITWRKEPEARTLLTGGSVYVDGRVRTIRSLAVEVVGPSTPFPVPNPAIDQPPAGTSHREDGDQVPRIRYPEGEEFGERPILVSSSGDDTWVPLRERKERCCVADASCSEPFSHTIVDGLFAVGVMMPDGQGVTIFLTLMDDGQVVSTLLDDFAADLFTGDGAAGMKFLVRLPVELRKAVTKVDAAVELDTTPAIPATL